MKRIIPHHILTILLLAAVPAVAQTQDYTYVTNNGAITITKYIGGDRVVTPIFEGSDRVTIYYLPENSGWDETYCDRPTALWQRPEKLEP